MLEYVGTKILGYLYDYGDGREHTIKVERFAPAEPDVDSPRLGDLTFYVGAETIVPAEDGKGIPRWQEALFAAMGRNAARMSDYLQLRCDQVVEIGREIEI